LFFQVLKEKVRVDKEREFFPKSESFKNQNKSENNWKVRVKYLKNNINL
jgi:hypothetical protein